VVIKTRQHLAAVKANGRVSIASTGAALTLGAANISGWSANARPNEVLLSANTALNVSGTIVANNLVSMHAGTDLNANLSLSVTGTGGTIDLAARNLTIGGATNLVAAKRIALAATQDLTVDTASLDPVAHRHFSRHRLVGRSLGAVVDRDDPHARHLSGEGHDATGDGTNRRSDQRRDIQAAVAGPVVRIRCVELAFERRRPAADSLDRPHP
jgi:hypothetical protein